MFLAANVKDIFSIILLSATILHYPSTATCFGKYFFVYNSISINSLAKQFGNNIIHKEARKEIRHSAANVDKINKIII